MDPRLPSDELAYLATPLADGTGGWWAHRSISEGGELGPAGSGPGDDWVGRLFEADPMLKVIIPCSVCWELLELLCRD